MEFVSNIPADEMRKVYTDGLVEIEKRIIREIINIRHNPETFTESDVDAILASEDDSVKDDITLINSAKILKELLETLSSIKQKLEAL
jgi:hypothetical protein